MATTQFAFCTVGQDHDLSVYTAGATTEQKTVSGTNATTTAAAIEGQRFCRVATDTAVYVSFGSAPNAGTDTIRFMMPANTVSWFRVAVGDKGAAITV